MGTKPEEYALEEPGEPLEFLPHPGAPDMPLTLARSLRTFRMHMEHADLLWIKHVVDT